MLTFKPLSKTINAGSGNARFAMACTSGCFLRSGDIEAGAFARSRVAKFEWNVPGTAILSFIYRCACVQFSCKNRIFFYVCSEN